MTTACRPGQGLDKDLVEHCDELSQTSIEVFTRMPSDPVGPIATAGSGTGQGLSRAFSEALQAVKLAHEDEVAKLLKKVEVLHMRIGGDSSKVITPPPTPDPAPAPPPAVKFTPAAPSIPKSSLTGSDSHSNAGEISEAMERNRCSADMMATKSGNHFSCGQNLAARNNASSGNLAAGVSILPREAPARPSDPDCAGSAGSVRLGGPSASGCASGSGNLAAKSGSFLRGPPEFWAGSSVDACEDPFILKWAHIVYRAMEEASKNQSELHAVWVQTETWVRQVRWNNVSVDVWAATKANKAVKGGRPGGRNKTAFQPLGSGLGAEESWCQRLRYELNAKWELWLDSGTLKWIESSIVVEPQSPLRIAWASIGVLMMMYDLVALPLQAFEPPEEPFFVGVNWFQQVFWTLDIFFSFLTAVHVNTEVVRELRVIAKKYITSWFVFDLTVNLPLWIQTFLGSGSSSLAAFKYVRMLRFLRLLRLAKFERMLSDALAAINSPVLLLVLGMVKLMVCLICLSHVNACLWFLVGKIDSDGGWTSQVRDKSIFYKYLVSMHWALTQFQGTSEIVPGRSTIERLYAVVTVLFSLLILSSFVSSLTNMMMQLQGLHAERTKQQRAVQAYLSAYCISNRLALRVKRYIEWHQAVQSCTQTEVFTYLPKDLVMDLELEVHGPLLSAHMYFGGFLTIYPRLSRRLFHEALSSHNVAPGELIFSTQETCFNMYFVVAGELDYTVIQRQQSIVNVIGQYVIHAGQYMSEPSLWMHWQHKGDLVVSGFANMLHFSVDEFGKVISTHPPAHASCVLYARRFLDGMIRFSWKCTDVIDPEVLIPEDKIFEEVGLLDILSGANVAHNRASIQVEEEEAQKETQVQVQVGRKSFFSFKAGRQTKTAGTGRTTIASLWRSKSTVTRVSTAGAHPPPARMESIVTTKETSPS